MNRAISITKTGPLLIIHSSSDWVVPITQSKMIIEELESAGNGNFKCITLPYGMHF